MRKSLSPLLIAAAIAGSGLALTGCDGKGSAEPLDAIEERRQGRSAIGARHDGRAPAS